MSDAITNIGYCQSCKNWGSWAFKGIGNGILDTSRYIGLTGLIRGTWSTSRAHPYVATVVGLATLGGIGAVVAKRFGFKCPSLPNCFKKSASSPKKPEIPVADPKTPPPKKDGGSGKASPAPSNDGEES